MVLYAVKDNRISVVTIHQGAVYTADSRGAGACFCNNIAIYLALTQHFCHNDPLGHCLQLLCGAKILKKAIALVLVLQRKNCFKKLVNSFGVYFLVHDIVPPVLHLSKV